ncbi:MAG: glycoside hydrolase family 16 protein [Rhodothermales bacterium]|nr:glycoside hydrolase family 16 protein [Rhodothermales bacterium]
MIGNIQTYIGCLTIILTAYAGCRASADDRKSSFPDDVSWELVWSDEFDGSDLDTTKWSYQIGDGCANRLCGWGNNELQWYTRENAVVTDGNLVIHARHDPGAETQFTSSRIRTLNQGDWKYGKFEVRAALPTGQGLWSAIWMMPSDNAYGSWAASGEVDIVEALGHLPDRVYGTLHYGDRWPENTQSGDTLFFDDTAISEFHTYSIIWQHGKIEWFVDDTKFGEQTSWYTSGHEFPAPFDKRFHLILNVAIGGAWPENPDSTTTFPQQMVVDYVRVYKPNTEAPPN